MQDQYDLLLDKGIVLYKVVGSVHGTYYSYSCNPLCATKNQ